MRPDYNTLATYHISGNFRCKNIFVVAINHENCIHEIIFTRVNSFYSQNHFAMLASYFAGWPSLDSYLQPRDGLLGNIEQTSDTFLAVVSVPAIIVSFFTAIAYAGTCLCVPRFSFTTSWPTAAFQGSG